MNNKFKILPEATIDICYQVELSDKEAALAHEILKKMRVSHDGVIECSLSFEEIVSITKDNATPIEESIDKISTASLRIKSEGSFSSQPLFFSTSLLLSTKTLYVSLNPILSNVLERLR